MKKKIALLMAVVMLFGVTVAGTLAYLMDTSSPVINTFTAGDINIKLTETELSSSTEKENVTNEYKIIPGTNITKDPKAYVLADSEACYLFVKVVESNWPAAKDENDTRKVNYEIATGWIALTGADGVYYREISAADAKAGISFPVLKDNRVTVSDKLTKTEIEAITAVPTLKFKAFAVQCENVTSATTAWAQIPASEKSF